MKKLVFALLISINSLAQSPDIQWQKTLGGTDYDGASCVQQTSDGGYILAGHTVCNDGDVTGNHGENDVWVVKLNATGVIVWQKALGGTLSDYANSIQQTSDGGYIVAGNTASNNGDVMGNHNTGYDDVWIVKLNSTGIILWQKTLGGTNHEMAKSIQQTSDGGYIFAGSTDSNDGDVSGNHSTFLDCWIVKLNGTGEIIWQKTMGGTSDDFASEIQQTSDGGYIIAGLTASNNGDVTQQHGIFDCWILKLNSIGEIIWQKTYGGTNQDSATSIQQTLDGGYIVAGNTYSNDGDVSGNHGDLDLWIVRLNASGTIVWQKSFGGTSTDYANSIKQRLDGSYIVAGYTYSNNGDVSGNHTTDNSLNDYWVIKLNMLGELVWQKTLGGTDGDFATCIHQTSDNGYILAGTTASNDGDVTENHGNGDYWVVKLASDNLHTSEFESVKNGIVYPNPSNNYFVIQTKDLSSENFVYNIIDLTGRIILSGNSKYNERINTESLKSGNYIIQIETKNRVLETKKLTKN
ncbi:MAG: T9SS type A sorting domain-containing protein [Flavobacterium sp.]|nr:MAG: T9SS type A sorting domain-containing protein [Flavobacterium sp.]